MNTDYNDEANSRANAGQELPDCSIARAIEIEVTEGSKPNKFKKATDSSKDNSNERKKRTNASKDDYNENPDPIRPTTSMFVNLPYMPADSPLCCPHVMDLTQERLTDGIIEGTLQISRADIVATILYNHGEETLKTFFDFDNYEYVEFKSHKYIRKPGSEKEELLSLLIIRAWDYVYVSGDIAQTTPSFLSILTRGYSSQRSTTPKTSMASPFPGSTTATNGRLHPIPLSLGF